MPFKHLTLALLVSSIAACGGGNDVGSQIGSLQDPTPEPTPDPDPITTSVNGKAIKGTIANATINVFKYVDGKPVELTEDEKQEADVSSNVDGSYTVTLLDYEGPVKVEVGVSSDTANPTTMICDAPDGCGNVVFGQSVNLTESAANFKLSSISSVSSGEPLTVNISPLTHIATALVEKEETIDAEAIANKKTQVANLFGIDGDITTLESTQIENNSDVAAEDNEAELRYALINAGIASALYSNGEDIAEGLELAVEDLVENDGQMLVNDDGDEAFELNLSVILEAATETAALVSQNLQNDESISDASAIVGELEQTATNLENERQNQILIAGDDGRTDVEAEEITADDAVAKAKAMVGDVRVFVNLFDDEHPSNEAIVTQGEEFKQLISDASDMVEAEEAAFVIISELSDVLAQISMSSSTETQYDLAQFQSLNGLQGQITVDESNYLFAVNATNELGQSVVFNAKLALTEDGNELLFTLDGSLESSNAMASIGLGSFISVELSESVSQAELESGEADVDIVSGEVALSIQIAQKSSETVTNPVTFKGDLTMSLYMVDVPEITSHYFEQYAWQMDTLQNEVLYKTEDKKRPYPKNLTLAGSFSSAAGEEIAASLTLDIKDLESFEAAGFASGLGEKAVEPVIFVSVTEDGNTVEWQTNEALFEETFGRRYTYTNLDSEVKTGYRLDFEYFGDVTDTNVTTDVRIVEMMPGDSSGSGVLNVFSSKRLYKSDSVVYLNYTYVQELDVDGDGVGEQYDYSRQTLNVAIDETSNVEYSIESSFDNEGNIIVNPNEVYYTSYIDAAYNSSSFEEYLNFNDSGFGLNINSALDVLNVNFVESKFGDEVYDLWSSKFGVLLTDKDDIKSIEAGAQEVEVGAFIVQPLIEDVLEITISDDNKAININVADEYTQDISIQTDESTALTISYSIDKRYAQNEIVISIEELDVGTEKQAFAYYVAETTTYSDGYQYENVEAYIAVNEDINADGVITTDEIQIHNGWGYSFGLDDITDEFGNITMNYVYDSYSEQRELKAKYGLAMTAADLNEVGADQLFTRLVIGASDVLNNFFSYQTPYFLNRFGSVELKDIGVLGQYSLFDSAEEDLMFEAGGTYTYDALVITPFESDSLESEDNFLDLSAALSVRLTLQDYEIDLMLSGQRTALKDGSFKLDASYKVPGDEAQRSFRVLVDSLDSDTFMVGNSDGVVFTMFPEVESEEAAEEGDEKVIGEIRVGAEAVLAAEVIERDGVTLIRYMDTEGSVETL